MILLAFLCENLEIVIWHLERGEEHLLAPRGVELVARLHRVLVALVGARAARLDQRDHRGEDAHDGLVAHEPERQRAALVDLSAEEFISDMWGKRGATYGEKGLCRRIQKTEKKNETENSLLTYGGNGVRHMGKRGCVGEFKKKEPRRTPRRASRTCGR